MDTDEEILKYLKYLTTLSTGSIVTLTALLEKLAEQPACKPLVGVAVIGFIVSVVFSVAAYTAYLREFTNDSIEGWVQELQGIGLFFGWLGFLAGVLFLGVFAAANIF